MEAGGGRGLKTGFLKRIISLTLTMAMLIVLAPITKAAEADYNTNDVAAIKNYLVGRLSPNPGTAPDDWTFIEWDTQTPKRAIGINLDKNTSGITLSFDNNVMNSLLQNNNNGIGGTLQSIDLSNQSCSAMNNVNLNSASNLKKIVLDNIGCTQINNLQTGSLQNVEYLSVAGNNFDSGLPNLGNKSKLIYIDISGSRVNTPNFSQYTNLEIIKYNNTTKSTNIGTNGPDLSNLTKLRELYLEDWTANKLTLPNPSTSLEILDLKGFFKGGNSGQSIEIVNLDTATKLTTLILPEEGNSTNGTNQTYALVFFDLNGGTLISGSTMVKGTSPQTYDIPVVEKAGYTAQWSGPNTLGTFSGAGTIAKYTAMFLAQTYMVTLHDNGATTPFTSLNAYTYGIGTTLPTDGLKTGFVFDGWYDNSGLTGSAITNISTTDTGDKEYWAKWTDNAKPTVVSVSPTGTGVALDGNVVITFSEAMDTANGTVSLSGTPLTGGVWSAGDTVLTFAYTDLDEETDYEITLEDFTDVIGNELDLENKTYTFTTGEFTAPTVVGLSPTGADIDVAGNIVIEFSEFMDETLGAVSLNGTAITGGVWTNGPTLTIPYTGLSKATEYAVTLNGFKDLAGNELDLESKDYTFTTKANTSGGGGNGGNSSGGNGNGGNSSAPSTTAPNPDPFKDVTKDKWFYNDVMEMYYRGLMFGTVADYFEPDAATERGMIVTILYRIAGSPAVTNLDSYPDVAQNKYYTKAIAWAKANGFAEGYKEDGLFHPEQVVSREELSCFIARYFLKSNTTGDIGYNDKGQIAEWAKVSVEKATKAGIIIGKEKNNFDPQGLALRSETATMFLRALKLK